MNRTVKLTLTILGVLGLVVVWWWITAGSKPSLPPPPSTQPVTATTPCGPPQGCCCSQDGYWLNQEGKPVQMRGKMKGVWILCERPDQGCPRAFPSKDGQVFYFPSGDEYEPITPQPICHYPSSCYCNCKKQWIGVTGQVDYEQRDFCVGSDLCLDCQSGGWKKDCVRRVQERHLPNIRTRVENENMDLR